jgi:hypothetical protein
VLALKAVVEKLELLAGCSLIGAIDGGRSTNK